MGQVGLWKCHGEDISPEIDTASLTNVCCHFAIVPTHLLFGATAQISNVQLYQLSFLVNIF